MSSLALDALFNTCSDAFCVFIGIWSTQVDIHFMSPLALEWFCQPMLKCIFRARWHGKVWSTHAVFHFYSSLSSEGLGNTQCVIFVSSLAWDGFGKHMLRLILCPCWHGKHGNISWDAFCVLAGMWAVWYSQVENNFLSSLTRDGFGQHLLGYIL